MSANPDTKEMAEKGDLKTLHENFNATAQQVEADFLKTKDLISRISQSVSEKEDQIYEKFREAGVEHLRKSEEEGGLLDFVGLASSIPSLDNLVKINAFIE